MEIQLNAMVTNLDYDGLEVKDADGTVRRIEAQCKVWSAGVQASSLGKVLAEQTGVELDRAGRVKVGPDLTVPGNPNVFVVGDMMAVDKVPGSAGARSRAAGTRPTRSRRSCAGRLPTSESRSRTSTRARWPRFRGMPRSCRSPALHREEVRDRGLLLRGSAG